jgi:hypothetical protein
LKKEDAAKFIEKKNDLRSSLGHDDFQFVLFAAERAG